MKIRPLVAELFLADRYTERHNEAKSHFPQYCEANGSKVEVISKRI